MRRIKTIFTIFSLICTLVLITGCVSSNQAADNKPDNSSAAVTKTNTASSASKKDSVKSVRDEYERATANMEGTKVSVSEFEADKKRILEIIDELNVIMKDRNYNAWTGYVDEDSVYYWSSKKNLAIASKQLPVKGIQLRTLEDYFNYIFIPSRMGRKIDEIRYESSVSIKAVQVKDTSIVIYYNFKKINNKWLVELPVLQ